MSNRVIEGDGFSLCMLDELSILRICKDTQDLSNIGLHFATKFRHEEHWRKKLVNNQLWTDSSGYLTVQVADEIIGIIWHFAHGIERSFELGLNIYSPKHRGKGIGESALRAYSSYLFNSYDINRLQYNMIEENKASEKVAIKCGYRCEGMQRQALFIRGQYRNVKLYSKLRGESDVL